MTPPRLWRHQWLRFVAVGCLNTAFSYAVYAAFLFAGLGYALANFLAMACGVLFSFVTQGRLVFGNAAPRLLLRFAAAWGCIYLFNIGVIALLVRGGLDAYRAGALALVPVTALSYAIQKFVVFNPPRTGANAAGGPAL